MEFSDWIKETNPQPNAINIPEDTLVSITFNQDINRNTLNTRNILVLDGKLGGILITNRFLFRYDADKRNLLIYPKDEVERLGSNNAIEIIVTGRVTNYKNVRMGTPFHLRFTTR